LHTGKASKIKTTIFAKAFGRISVCVEKKGGGRGEWAVSLRNRKEYQSFQNRRKTKQF
jgi:hypothetical protein